MTFNSDLKFGQETEYKLKKYLETKGEIVTMAPSGKFKPYDLISNGIKYECKSDRMTHRTGNICIEHTCNQKPSGITSTESDFYIYRTLTDTYKIPTARLRKEIIDKRYHRDIKCGDGWRAQAYLFKASLFDDCKLEDFNTDDCIRHQD